MEYSPSKVIVEIEYMSWGYNPKPWLLYVAGCSGGNVAQLALRLMPTSRRERNVSLCQAGSVIDNRKHGHCHHHRPAPEP